jgi:pseudouridine synthase
MSRRGKRSEAGRRAPRLQQIIAAAGIASRRSAEDLIRQGRVRVNDEVVRELGARADPERDRICVDGRPLGRLRPRVSYVVYKPRGVVTTTRDPHAKRTVLDLLPARERLFPVGRLDAPSEGLLLLTNDGEIAQALLHPSFEVPRTYRVSVAGHVPASTLARLSRGIELDGRLTAPCEIRIVERDARRMLLEVVLREGRHRQIRRMLRAVGLSVRRLVRTRFGPLTLRGLRPGEWRPLRADEQRALKRVVEAPREPQKSGKTRPKAKGGNNK